MGTPLSTASAWDDRSPPLLLHWQEPVASSSPVPSHPPPAMEDAAAMSQGPGGGFRKRSSMGLGEALEFYSRSD